MTTSKKRGEPDKALRTAKGTSSGELAEMYRSTVKALERIEEASADFVYTVQELKAAFAEAGASFDGDETAADVAAYDAAKAEGGEPIPADVVERLVAGDNAIQVFRKWRGLNQKQLARAIGSSPAYLSQLETGNRTASNTKLRAIADALDIDFALLVDWYSRD